MGTPKIEIRSTTGNPYRRAGAVWTPYFQVVDLSAFDAEQQKLLKEDAHLEIRVDGKRVSHNGVEVSIDDVGAGDESEAPTDTPPTNELKQRFNALADRTAELELLLEDLQTKHTALSAENEKANEANAKLVLEKDVLTARVSELESALAAAKAATPAETPPTSTPETSSSPRASSNRR